MDRAKEPRKGMAMHADAGLEPDLMGKMPLPPFVVSPAWEWEPHKGAGLGLVRQAVAKEPEPSCREREERA